MYSSVTADLFHYGHLRLLQQANELGDFHICGVVTDNAIKSYKKSPIAGLKERKTIISDLRCVDMVMIQDDLDPTQNLRKIHEQFPGAKIILVYGSNWKKIPGADYIKKVNGSVVQPQYYEKLSTENVIKKIFKVYKKGVNVQ
ncbi:adenylyltransferase/cytidyltransferase family protein [archaeon AH-315-M20]|nr:adenylyltransferase/cytidyltransferase family protein [archaeon AH-315-M20]